jgi:hypothetical protein
MDYVAFMSTLSLALSAVLLWLAWVIHRNPYPGRPPWRLSWYYFLTLCGDLGAVIVICAVVGRFPLAIMLVLATAYGIFTYTTLRYCLVTSLINRPTGKPLSAWRAYVAAMYYLRHGSVMISVCRQPRYATYRIRIRHPQQGTLVSARLVRSQVPRLLQSLANHYPYPRRLRPGWAVGAITIWSRNAESAGTVRHRVIPAFRTGWYDAG